MKKTLLFFILFVIFVFASNLNAAQKRYDQISPIKVQIDSISNSMLVMAGDIKDLKSKVSIFIWIICTIGLVAIGSYLSTLYCYVIKKFKKLTNAAFYKADPTYHKVVLVGLGMDNEFQRLKKIGLKDISSIVTLSDNCKTGCIVCKYTDENSLTVLKDFIENNSLNDEEVGFIIYADKIIKTEILNAHKNIFVLANTPHTLINAIYTICRWLTK